jgi:hypothetical protein
MSMDNYIIRVLRREKAQKDTAMHLDGVVETVDGGTREAFHNANELWAILLGAHGETELDDRNTNKKEDKETT